MIFELDNGKVINHEYRENKGKNRGECGTCDHAMRINNIKDCQVVIGYGMGQRIYSDLMNSNISAVVTEEKNVKDAIEKKYAR